MNKLTQKDIKLGKNISRARHKVGITQEKLAEKVGVSTTHVGLVETGNRHVSLKTLQKIASVLNLKVKDLIPY